MFPFLPNFVLLILYKLQAPWSLNPSLKTRRRSQWARLKESSGPPAGRGVLPPCVTAAMPKFRDGASGIRRHVSPEMKEVRLPGCAESVSWDVWPPEGIILLLFWGLFWSSQVCWGPHCVRELCGPQLAWTAPGRGALSWFPPLDSLCSKHLLLEKKEATSFS